MKPVEPAAGVAEESKMASPVIQSWMIREIRRAAVGLSSRIAGWQIRNRQRPQETSGFASGFEKLFYAGAHVFVGDVFAAVERG